MIVSLLCRGGEAAADRGHDSERHGTGSGRQGVAGILPTGGQSDPKEPEPYPLTPAVPLPTLELRHLTREPSTGQPVQPHMDAYPNPPPFQSSCPQPQARRASKEGKRNVPVIFVNVQHHPNFKPDPDLLYV